jgi:hypothetical protein
MPEKLTAAQAQIVANIIKKFLQEMIEPIDLEFVANAALLNAVRQTDPGLASKLDGLLNDLRRRPDLRELMHQKYHVSLEQSLRQFVEGIQDMENMEQILRDWKPGQMN